MSRNEYDLLLNIVNKLPLLARREGPGVGKKIITTI
jgi:hypothetical protein